MSYQRYVFFLAAAIAFLFTSQISQAQNSQRFQKEVDSIVSHNLSVDKADLILFTGSSSIRMWKDLKKAFPNHNVVNLGFGGSEMADLLYYIDRLVLQFKPKQVFIYEGDNDIAVGRSPEKIFAAADATLARIQEELPNTEVVFISPKPSVARWHLKDKYEAFNTRLHAWTKEKRNVKYADVWTPMLKKDGVVRDDIFLGDNLHMNKKGYAIWTTELGRHLK
jgi:lysophospholipase L1-like esterase